MHMKQFRWLFFVGCCIGFLFVTTGCPSSTLVFFTDKNLENAVRAELHHPLGGLTQADLLELRTLDARSMEIQSLSGLEYAVNLTWLDLDTNSVTNLTPLSNLINITYLNLDSNQITDITPLAGLRNLNVLSLFDNQIADIQALVANAVNGGLGAGDSVILDANTLSEHALTIDVPELELLGVVVTLVEAAAG